MECKHEVTRELVDVELEVFDRKRAQYVDLWIYVKVCAKCGELFPQLSAVDFEGNPVDLKELHITDYRV